MAASINPLASDHLPAFITAPGDTDVLLVVMSFVLLISVLTFGILFWHLHTLPERIAHKSHKLQFEIVAILGLISLFTHMHIFWIAGLLLAMIDIPDFGNALGRIAGSAEKMAGLKPGEGANLVPPETTSRLDRPDEAPAEAGADHERSHNQAPLPKRPELVPTSTRS